MTGNPKAEIRNPKEARNPKSGSVLRRPQNSKLPKNDPDKETLKRPPLPSPLLQRRRGRKKGDSFGKWLNPMVVGRGRAMSAELI